MWVAVVDFLHRSSNTNRHVGLRNGNSSSPAPRVQPVRRWAPSDGAPRVSQRGYWYPQFNLDLQTECLEHLVSAQPELAVIRPRINHRLIRTIGSAGCRYLYLDETASRWNKVPGARYFDEWLFGTVYKGCADREVEVWFRQGIESVSTGETCIYTYFFRRQNAYDILL